MRADIAAITAAVCAVRWPAREWRIMRRLTSVLHAAHVPPRLFQIECWSGVLRMLEIGYQIVGGPTRYTLNGLGNRQSICRTRLSPAQEATWPKRCPFR